MFLKRKISNFLDLNQGFELEGLPWYMATGLGTVAEGLEHKRNIVLEWGASIENPYNQILSLITQIPISLYEFNRTNRQDLNVVEYGNPTPHSPAVKLSPGHYHAFIKR